MSGVLSGVQIVEFNAIGPVPHAAAQLGAMGASMVRVDRPGTSTSFAEERYPLQRDVIHADLKDPTDREAVLELIAQADVVLEGFRPGVMERLGLGPDECLQRNAGLVYGRMTGWGQTGPRAHQAGHDINYIASTGALGAITRHGGPPVPPLNLLGDFGGGSMFLVVGVLGALLERTRSGLGQVIDAAIVDGTTTLMAGLWGGFAAGAWTDRPGSNLLDTGAPFYDTYECADGGYLAVGPIEPQFYHQLVTGLNLDPASLPDREDPQQWPALRGVLATAIAAAPRSHWEQVFEGSDACVAPILTMNEALTDPHLLARGTLHRDGETIHVGSAPRFSRSVHHHSGNTTLRDINELLAGGSQDSSD